ncbi:hypothetical protein CBS101457_002053 [Exobasidium rhododendri]|nr:hypothetical protein CBS101457_002053 [Exobasidium rhododendri]
MSNIYITEPPYSGKVILETNKGDIEIELFAKECPQACKNFIALALEGYYDNLIWHRVIPDFIVQTGDPSGSGLGGESFYGQSFSDELHQRLRFNRRGLLGMANASLPNSNDSQFFLTLASTPELQGRHTMFGRINNNTIYNLVSMAEGVGEIGEDDRPAFPPKLKTIRVVENPFEGEIQLRVTKEEREEMKRNRLGAAKRLLERKETGDVDKKKNKKNTSLLSFGQDEDVADDERFKGPKSSHDLLKNDKRLRAESARKSSPSIAIDSMSEKGQKVDEESAERRRTLKDTKEPEVALSDLRSHHVPKAKESSSADKIADLEASLRGSAKQITEGNAKEKRSGRGKNLLQEYREKYKKSAASSSSSSKRKDEETASMLSSFQKRLRAEAKAAKQEKRILRKEGEEVPKEYKEYGASDGEDDDDEDWRSHRFDFGGKALANDGHDGDEYVTLDPRDTTSSKAAQLGFGGSDGAKKAQEERARDGRRGRDWVDSREGKGKDSSGRDSHHRRGDGSKSVHYSTGQDTRKGPAEAQNPRKDLERW